MRLHVPDTVAGRSGEGVERADLVQDVVGEVVGGVVDAAAAEAGQVAVADLGSDADVPGHRRLADPAHDGRVAGVEAAGDVGTGDQGQERFVVAEGPAAESLAQICVKVDHPAHHSTPGTVLAYAPVLSAAVP